MSPAQISTFNLLLLIMVQLDDPMTLTISQTEFITLCTNLSNSWSDCCLLLSLPHKKTINLYPTIIVQGIHYYKNYKRPSNLLRHLIINRLSIWTLVCQNLKPVIFLLWQRLFLETHMHTHTCTDTHTGIELRKIKLIEIF